MDRRGITIALAAVVISVSPVGARPNDAAGGGKEVSRIPPPLDWDQVGPSDGLQQSNVQAILQDNLGFLWLGTQDGLARYDGTKMRTYREVEGDPTSMLGSYITALVLDASGKIWVGTDKGANLYDPTTDQFTRYKFTVTAGGANTDSAVVGIVRDRKDRIWLAMGTGGLSRFDSAKNSFVEYVAPPLEVNVSAIDGDKAGNLWLGTANAGVLRWNPDDGKTASYKSLFDQTGSQVNAILVATSGKVWVGTENDGLYELDPATNKVAKYRHDVTNADSLSDDHISALYEDKTGGVWIATHNGLNRIDKTGVLVQHQHDPNNHASIIYPWITALYQDKAGVFYAGAKVGGLCKFPPLRPKFGHYSMRTATANSFHEDADGTLWIGTYHGGLFRYDMKADRVTTYRTLGTPGTENAVRLDSAWISQVHRDKRGTLWIATQELGLIAFDTDAETFKQYRAIPNDKNALPVDFIWDIWEGDNGVLWLATFGGGLVRFDPKANKFTSITVESGAGLTSDQLYRLYPDPNGKVLWIGTGKGGLDRFDLATNTATSFRHKDNDPSTLSSDDVLSIYRDPSGIVWVGTYGGGFNRLDPATGKAEHWTTTNSPLKSDVILGILGDDDGKLWLSTNGGGLVNFDPKSKNFVVYESSDGVQDNEFGQGSYMRSKSGKLYFGGVGGFNAFFSKDIQRDSYVPPVVLTGAKIFNQDLKLEKPIWTLPALSLSYSDSFELQFAALSFAAQHKNRYAYRLEGFDDKFIETDRPFATYTKLNGGSYTLRVRAANEHGVWNEEGIALTISVAPPWWRTWPAFALYVALIAAAAFVLFRVQQNRVRRVQRESRLAVVERDLELTGAVQSGFLPNYNQFEGNRVRLFGFYRAADACSGDWWWHEMLADGRHVILVGDVTGHGPGPAMVTAAVATAFHVLTQAGAIDVLQTLEILNRVVLHVAKGKYHMTMAALELDERSGQWTFHNAGAPPMLTVNSTGKHRVHFCAGSPLGSETEFTVGRVDGVLEASERIMLYTDGIPEIQLPNKNVLGIRRFAQQYERTKGQPLHQAATSLAQLAEQQQSGAPQADDWTFILIEWT